MKNKIINGVKIAATLQKQLTAQTTRLIKLGQRPKLAVVLAGQNGASLKYVGKKRTAARQIGVIFKLYRFPATVSAARLRAEIKNIQRRFKPHGLIIQLPLPAHLPATPLLNAVSPDIDVDCLNEANARALERGQARFVPPTAAAVLEILKQVNINPKNKTVAVVGQGRLAGRPLTLILKNLGARVIACDKATPDLKAAVQKADIVISAVGKRGLIKAPMVKPGATVIDVGTVAVGKKIYGDVDFNEVKKRARFITPVPGGVGPLTVIKLLANTVLSARRQLYVPYATPTKIIRVIN